MADQAPVVHRWINIMPLIGDHERETADDIRRLSRESVVDATAFICTLVPEGDPPFDKAAAYARRFGSMRARLADDPSAKGLLFQATMGHGWTPDSLAPYQKVTTRDGFEPYVFCPLGRPFLDYVRQAARTLVSLRPDFVMLDDDTRLITGRNGCFCPLHVAEMSRRAGRPFTRESLVAALADDPSLARLYDALLEDSIAGLAQAIREEMDRVDPSMPGYFCCCQWDARHAGRIAGILAARGQRRVIRLNNGRYLHDIPRDIPQWMLTTAIELATLPEDALVLDEPDTCPQNRYSTSATAFHGHVALSLLLGCGGAKLWITRLSDFEPGSGEAYRRSLVRNSGMYREIVRLAPRWRGVRSPMPSKPFFQITGCGDLWARNWGSVAFAHFGIPYTEDRAAATPIASLAPSDVDRLSDGDLRSILRGRVLVDGGAAVALAGRGFAASIGVRAKEWALPSASFETSGGLRINSMIRAVDLTDHDPGAETLSTLHHRSTALAEESQPVAPGALLFRNAEGGVALTMAVALPAGLFLDSFDFFNETRKRQVVGFLNLLAGAERPGTAEASPAWGGVYYPGDAELLVKAGDGADGSSLLALVNLGLDTLDGVPLVFARKPSRVQLLGGDGTWRDVDLRDGGAETTTLGLRLETLRPALLRLDPA